MQPSQPVNPVTNVAWLNELLTWSSRFLQLPERRSKTLQLTESNPWIELDVLPIRVRSQITSMTQRKAWKHFSEEQL